MKTITIRLECIGDHLRAMRRDYERAPRRCSPVASWHYMRPPPPEPWVAAVEKRGGELIRSRLTGFKDYTEANGKGSHGVYLYYHLRRGVVYEVNEPVSWTKSRRYFCRVHEGGVQELTENEVHECLSENGI